MSDEGIPNDGTPEPAGQIIIQPEQMAGVWANFATVSHGEYEFTLDFARLGSSISASPLEDGHVLPRRPQRRDRKV